MEVNLSFLIQASCMLRFRDLVKQRLKTTGSSFDHIIWPCFRVEFSICYIKSLLFMVYVKFPFFCNAFSVLRGMCLSIIVCILFYIFYSMFLHLLTLITQFLTNRMFIFYYKLIITYYKPFFLLCKIIFSVVIF